MYEISVQKLDINGYYGLNLKAICSFKESLWCIVETLLNKKSLTTLLSFLSKFTGISYHNLPVFLIKNYRISCQNLTVLKIYW